MATKIINSKKFKSYDETKQQLFEACREGCLTLMPKVNKDGEVDDNGFYDDFTITYCETFAFAIVDNFPEKILELPKRLDELETNYSSVIERLVKLETAGPSLGGSLVGNSGNNSLSNLNNTINGK